jgi:hypothetical protein
MSSDDRKSEAALRIMYEMCRVAILAAAGPGNPRGEEAIRWWQREGSAQSGWQAQAAVLALAVGYAAGHLEKENLATEMAGGPKTMNSP